MKSGLEPLIERDPDLVRLGPSEHSVAVTPKYQGRIFCALEGELMHRLDVSLLDAPPGGAFKNLGGNSLWPAPEGGVFAFNYPPDSDAWYVQPAVADQPARVLEAGEQAVEIGKTAALLNRRGTTLRIDWRRRVRLAPADAWPDAGGLAAVAYSGTDSFTPLDGISVEDALVAPWSLEQFPGGEGVTAFAKADDPEQTINYDFYGSPEQPASFGPDYFLWPLGGSANVQIGVRASHRPTLLGALDRRRELLILRRTPLQKGRYFNIADNEQPDGPWSAADLYSVFNGGQVGFFELETIAPAQIVDDRLATSTLTSETLILRGPMAELQKYLTKNWGIER